MRKRPADPARTRGQELIALGFLRWEEYCRQREGKSTPKALTDFYAEAFDEELAARQGGEIHKRAALALAAAMDGKPV